MAARINLMVTVKAYPSIAATGEAVCVAGIRTDTDGPQWVRLWPIPFRDLPFAQQFKKYEVISIEAREDTRDGRPESMRPNVDTLAVERFISTAGNWQRRRQFVDPLVVDSMCWLRRQQRVDRTSLGVFRPREVTDFTIEELSEEWDTRRQAIIDQPSLLAPTQTGLERIPFRFRYRYLCTDDACPGHHQSIIDWELSQSYRSWRHRYSESELFTKIRERWLDDLCGPHKDTHFFVGNQHQHPEAFIVLGVFYPRAPSTGVSR